MCVIIKDMEEKQKKGRFPNNIKKYREERGLSVYDVAFQMDCSLKSVYRWESGSCVPDTPERMYKLLRVFGPNVTYEDIWPENRKEKV